MSISLWRAGVALVAGLAAAEDRPAWGQVTAEIRGAVVDAQDGAVPGAALTLRHPSSGLERTTWTDADGRFAFPNLPAGLHDVTAALDGFRPDVRRVTAPAGVVEVRLRLVPAGITDRVVVRPAQPAVDDTSGGTRHAVSVTRIERLPVAATSRGLEAVLVTFPGFAQNANGAIHPRGAHNQMTFVVDGLPISDQLAGAFATSLDVGVVETAEVLTGHIPAEFGGKVSGVAVLTGRSGLGTGRRSAGALAVAAGGFGTTQATAQWGGEHGRAGYFASVTALDTDRFLDQVSLDNLHNAGRVARGYARLDLRLGGADVLRLHAMGGASRFELANLRSQQAAGQDQRQRLQDASVWAAYLRPLGAAGTLEATVGFRTTTAGLDASPGDTPVTAWQRRRLSTTTLQARYTRTSGRAGLRAGLDLQVVPVRERFSMALTSPDVNVPGTPAYNDALTAHDLTRDGAPFRFADARTGVTGGAFVVATVQAGALALNAGVRHDEYHFLVQGRQAQPRIGASYRIAGRDLVLRASYNRNYQTPPNENLLLSNSAAAGRLAPDSVRQALGRTVRAIRPERQDVVEAGVQAALGGAFTLDGAVYRKWSRDQQDNNNFLDTGIIFPTTLRRLRVIGAELRLTALPRRGLSGSLSATTARAIATPPFTGGLFLGQDAVDLLSAGDFAIDHDQRLGVHATGTYDPEGPFWASVSVRHDSGLVANPSDPAAVAADPDFADLLPYVRLTGGTPRVRPRTVVDLGLGADIARATGARTWSVQLQVTNLTNRTALYNFQSVFVGTRIVQPRTLSVRITRHF
ncbi:MAG: carboxypeptidase regulatory-like domain-containing protein [Vicinamibacterales bacterium]